MSKITIIAEIGVNHNGDMGLAEELIHLAKISGADIVKTQVYSPEKLFPTHEVMVNGVNYYDYVMKTELGKKELWFLKKCADNEGIEFMASAFDLERLSWLEELGVKRHKIASRYTDQEYKNKVASTGKEVLISCQHRHDSYVPYTIYRNNFKYLYCVPKYPTEMNELHLNEVLFSPRTPTQNLFQGFSDHTFGILASVAAMSRGAVYIEKHFTLTRNMFGCDHAVSLEPVELKRLIQYARLIEEML